MLFDTPATTNPIDQLKIVGQPVSRIDGPNKTTGTATYAYEWHDPALNHAYGYVVGSAIAKGRISSMDVKAVSDAPGVITVVTADSAGELGKGKFNTATLFGGPEIQHYHQAIAVVVAETFEQARAAAQLVKVEYVETDGVFDLASVRGSATKPKDGEPDTAAGDFTTAFAAAAVQLDQMYTTPDQAHAMMEPHASLAVWEGDELTVWTSNQMIAWTRADLATTLGMDLEKVHLMSPFIGGGFGGKLSCAQTRCWLHWAPRLQGARSSLLSRVRSCSTIPPTGRQRSSAFGSAQPATEKSPQSGTKAGLGICPVAAQKTRCSRHVCFTPAKTA